MAENTSYIEKSGVKAMPWSTFFTRTSDIPLDRSSIFGSYEDACKYAAGDEQNPDTRNLVTASYVGQIITVYEKDEVDVYKINAKKQLEPVGQGKGVIITKDETETKEVIAKEKTIGNLILRLDIKKLYLVVAKNVIVEVFALNTNNDIVIDCGTF